MGYNPFLNANFCQDCGVCDCPEHQPMLVIRSYDEYDPDVPVTVSPVPLDMDSVEAVGGRLIKFDIPGYPTGEVKRPE